MNGYVLQEQEIDAELERRDDEVSRLLAYHSLAEFGQYVHPWWKPEACHLRLCEKLEAVDRGEIKRLIVMWPPRHGKSEIASVLFPAWRLGRHPDSRVIGSTYGKLLTERFSRRARNLVESERYRRVFEHVALSRDSRSVTEWNFDGYRGGFLASSVGAALTGMGADIGLIDDPVKGFEAAESAIQREAVWEWYLNDFYTRIEGDGGLVVIMTRWHEDDLVGRLLADTEGDEWEVVRLPALAEENDILGRAEGDALWPSKYPAERLQRIRSVMGERRFAGLYQQRPAPREGAMFHRAWFPIVDAVPAQARRLRYWDKAGTAGGGDYSCGGRLAEAGGIYYVERPLRGQWSSNDRNTVMKQTAETDGRTVPVWVEQEPGSGGKESAEISVKLLAGYDVHTERVTGSKEARAAPLAAQAEAGNVRLVRGDWNAAFLDEFEVFPNGAHDDQVDAYSGAFNHLALPEVSKDPTYNPLSHVRMVGSNRR